MQQSNIVRSPMHNEYETYDCPKSDEEASGSCRINCMS